MLPRQRGSPGVSCAPRLACAHVCACVCAAGGACVRTLRRSVHAQPRWPSAASPISFLWEQRLPLPSAMGHRGAAASKAPARPRSRPSPGGSSQPWGGAGVEGWLWTLCPWLPSPPLQGRFCPRKTKPRPSPWVLNYSINNAAGAIPGPERTAAVTWLPSPASESPPSSDLRGTGSPGSSAGGIWLSQHPPASPRMWLLRGTGAAPNPGQASPSMAPKTHPKSRTSISICRAPKTPKQRASQGRGGRSFALKAGICPFYYIRRKGTARPPHPPPPRYLLGTE